MVYPSPARQLVIPAQAGIHILKGWEVMDSRLRGSDGIVVDSNKYHHTLKVTKGNRKTAFHGEVCYLRGGVILH